MLRKVFSAVAAAVLAMVALTVPASAAPSHWECRYVPSGYTYTMVRADQGCTPLYYVTPAETGIWACYVPPGFTYTATRTNYSCALGGTAPQYLLARI